MGRHSVRRGEDFWLINALWNSLWRFLHKDFCFLYRAFTEQKRCHPTHCFPPAALPDVPSILPGEREGLGVNWGAERNCIGKGGRVGVSGNSTILGIQIWFKLHNQIYMITNPGKLPKLCLNWLQCACCLSPALFSLFTYGGKSSLSLEIPGCWAAPKK